MLMHQYLASERRRSPVDWRQAKNALHRSSISIPRTDQPIEHAVVDRPVRPFTPRPATELKLINHSVDLRLHGDGDGPWSFIQPGGRCLATQRRICQALAALLCGATGLLAFFSLRMASVEPVLHGLPAVLGISALLLGFAWKYRQELRNRCDGELAAAAIRKEMARSPANDRLFAVVYRDVGAYLELLAFFQEGNGSQRLETIRAPRLSDGSKQTETDFRSIRKALDHHFSDGQINDLNVVPIGSISRADEADQRTQNRA